MTRILYSLLLVVGCMGFPVHAKDTHSSATSPAPTASAKSTNASTTIAKAAKTSTTKASTTSVAKISAPVTPSASTKNSTDLVSDTSTQTTLCSKTLITTIKNSKTSVTTSAGPVLIGSSATSNAKGGTAFAGGFPSSDKPAANGRLARLTTYWPSEGDYYTRHGISSTGIRLHGGHCAVDPRIIPYGSVVDIAGVGKYLAVDTGSAVISREAAREAARTTAEREALVIDLYFESRGDAQQFSNNAPKYASISWYTPTATGTQATAARHLFADENWSKIQNKQL